MISGKICFITTSFVTMDAFVIPSMRYLKTHDSGVEISLLCDMPEEFVRRNSDFARCFPVPMERGVDLFGALKSIWIMYRIFRREQFDLIRYSTPNGALYASIAGRLAGVQLRIYDQWGIRYVGFNGWRRILFRNLERLTCRLSTAIRGVSFKNRQLAIKEHLCSVEKITVLGIGGTIGVDLEEFNCLRKVEFCAAVRTKWNILPNDFVFGFIGRLHRDKGIHELVEAFRCLWMPQSGLKLLLVGAEDGGLSRELQQWLKNCPDVILVGQVPATEICRYLSAMDVLVHPSYREGFGKVLQEALAMEVPIITTAIPGPSEVIEAEISGVLVPPKDARALSETMARLRNAPELRQSLTRAGRERVQRYFSRSVMLQNIRQDYDNLMGKGNSEK